MLWRFEFLVDGAKQMEEVLWMIQGRARDIKTPVPVVNANIVGGHARAKHPNILAALTAECRKHEAVTPKIMKNFLTNLGYAPAGYSKYLTNLLETGILGPKRAGTYKVIQPKAKASPKAKRKAKHKRKAAPHKANSNGVSATT